jgi:predicted Zn-dependent peptidase
VKVTSHFRPSQSRRAPVFGLNQSSSKPLSLQYEVVGPLGYPLSLYRFPNGFQVVLENRANAPVSSLRVFMNTGSIIEDAMSGSVSSLYPQSGFKPGATHLLEHVLYTHNQADRRLNGIADQLDKIGQFNAHTTPEMVDHEMTCEPSQLRPALSVMTKAVLSPVFDGSGISQEKRNVNNEVAMRHHSAESGLQDRAFQASTGRALFQTGGRPEDIETITPRDLAALYKETYQPEKMALVVSGDLSRVNLTEMLTDIEASFGRLKNSKNQSYDNEVSLKTQFIHAQPVVQTVYDSRLSYCNLMLSFPAPSYRDKVARLAFYVVANYLTDPVYGILKPALERSGNVINQSVAFNPSKKSGTLDIEIHAPLQSAPSWMTLQVLQTLALLKTQPIPREVFEGIKKTLTLQYTVLAQRTDKNTLWLGEELLKSGSLSFYLACPELLQRLTPEDVRRALCHFIQENTYTATVGLPSVDPGFAYKEGASR